MNRTFTDATLNVLHKNTRAEIQHDITLALDHAHVLGLQEVETPAARAAFRAACRRPHIDGFLPFRGREDSILWDTEVFRALPGRGVRRSHKGVAGISPSRYFVWQPLLHRETGRKVLKINTHAVSGYASGSAGQRDEHGRDVMARKHWALAVELTGRFIGSHKYDAILLGGDFNCRLENHDEPFYPGPMLRGLYTFDAAHKSIDRLIYTHESRVSTLTRTAIGHGVNSDHAIHLHALHLR